MKPAFTAVLSSAVGSRDWTWLETRVQGVVSTCHWPPFLLPRLPMNHMNHMYQSLNRLKSVMVFPGSSGCVWSHDMAMETLQINTTIPGARPNCTQQRCMSVESVSVSFSEAFWISDQWWIRRFGPWNLFCDFSPYFGVSVVGFLAAKARNMIVNHLQQRYLGIAVQIWSGESWVTLREGLIWDRLVERGTSTSRFSMLVNYILYYICIMICPGWRQFRSRECTIVRPDSYLFQVILSFDEICAISQPVPSGKHSYILFQQVCFSESERVGNLTTDVHLLKIHGAFLELELLIFCHVLRGLPLRWVLRFFVFQGWKNTN